MGKYQTIILDLDDTLIDNNLSIKHAFTITLNQLGIRYSDELFERWKKFDTAYWHEWESGNMIIPNTIKNLEEKITYLRANRFILFFKELNLSYKTAIEINDLYCSMLGINIVEIDGASNLLNDVSKDHEIIIATNGPKLAAIDKTKKANLDSFISFIVSSEEVGFSKPMPQFFDYLFEKTKNKDRNKALLIGDSLTTDILGGMNNGIDTCWFNPNNNILPSEYNPTMVINKLLQLKKKL